MLMPWASQPGTFSRGVCRIGGFGAAVPCNMPRLVAVVADQLRPLCRLIILSFSCTISVALLMRCHSLAGLLLDPELVHHKLRSLLEIPALIPSALGLHNSLQIPGEQALLHEASVELLNPILFPEVTFLTKPGPFQPPIDEIHVIPFARKTISPIGNLLPGRDDPAVLVLQELRDVLVDPTMPGHERMELVKPSLG